MSSGYNLANVKYKCVGNGPAKLRVKLMPVTDVHRQIMDLLRLLFCLDTYPYPTIAYLPGTLYIQCTVVKGCGGEGSITSCISDWHLTMVL
jgi:hypothetical protein